MRIACFFLAILLYALFSSPTPDSAGLAEITIMALILIAVTPAGAIGAITRPHLPAPLGYHRFFCLFMLSVPLIIGVVNGYATGDIIRDLIPVMALCLPLPLPLMTINPPVRSMAAAMGIAGFVFSLRYLLAVMPDLSIIGLNAQHDNLLYLANAPLVPFACLYGFAVLTDPEKKMLGQRITGGVITLVTFLAMACMVQRATFILCLTGCIAIAAIRLPRNPLTIVVITSILAIIITPYLPLLLQISDGMIEKTMTLGLNSRWDEITALIPHGTVFGQGWGALWQSPAVGDYWVRYTHNMFSYYWLKAGMIGSILAIGFALLWIRLAAQIVFRHNFALGLALIIPLLIHIFLYTGYKTFDFALLITLTYLCNKDRQASLSSTVPFRRNSVRRDGLPATLPCTSGAKATT